MGTDPLERLHHLGISLSLDYISRDLLAGGALQRLVDEDYVVGVTSNPIIFGKAISSDHLYESQLRAAEIGSNPEQVALDLMVRDIQVAADILRPVYDASAHFSGLVSLEVPPRFAHSYTETLVSARALWNTVARPNLLVKIPATAEGIAALEECVADGINVNCTVIFSVRTYEAVSKAYLRAMRRRKQRGQSMDVASFASVFVGRLDPPIDDLLEGKMRIAASQSQRRRLEGLRGRGALANAELIYARSRELAATLGGWLLASGGREQAIIWASLGARGTTSDTKYVDGLLTPGTVLTMPEATLQAFRDHGNTARMLGSSLRESRAIWNALGRAGLSPDRIAAAMEEQILELFETAYQGICAEVAKKLTAIQAPVG